MFNKHIRKRVVSEIEQEIQEPLPDLMLFLKNKTRWDVENQITLCEMGDK